MPQLSNLAKKRIQAHLDKSDARARGLDLVQADSVSKRAARKRRALKDYKYFVETYFPHLAKCPTGKFQIEAANELAKNEPGEYLFEWARGHAKSTHFGCMMPMWKIARGELNGMIYVSATQDHAAILMGDVQRELEFNKQFAEDFGEQYNPAEWAAEQFTTLKGVPFFAVGARTSPRGLKFSGNRPNYILVDDYDTDQDCRNPKIVKQKYIWLMGALKGCMDMGRGQFVLIGNRIAVDTVLGHYAKRSRLFHTRVNAIDAKGNPSWPEKFTKAEIEALRDSMIQGGSWMEWETEYMNNPIVNGDYFKQEYIQWKTPAPLRDYSVLLLYGDPAFSKSGQGDYKAWSLWGKWIEPSGAVEYHLLKVYLRKSTEREWAAWACRMYAELSPEVREKFYVYIEEFVNQSNCLLTFKDLSLEFGFLLPVRLDIEKNKRKQNKQDRILASLRHYEKMEVFYSLEEKSSPEMELSIQQTLSFDPANKRAHDDSPDANAGALKLLSQSGQGRASKNDVNTNRPRKRKIL